MKDIAIITGSSHPELAKKIAKYIGVEISETKLGKFSNRETSVEITSSVRNKHVYIIQSSCGNINDNFIEMLIIVQACLMGSARRISVVTPLFPYSRQSKLSQRRRLLKSHANEPTEEIEGLKTGYKSWAATSGTLIASLIQESGADHLIVMDLHEPQYQGFFTIPVDSVYAEPVIINYIKTSIPNWRSAVVVSPTAGGAKRATSISNKLHLQFALVHNAGDRYQQESEAVGLVGDVTDRVTIMIDDMIDTASTMLNASKMLKAHGAKEIHVIVIHGIFSSDSIDKINKSSIDTIACTNSVPQDDFRSLCPKLQTIDVSTILGETIRRSFNGESVTKLYEYDEY